MDSQQWPNTVSTDSNSMIANTLRKKQVFLQKYKEVNQGQGGAANY